MVTMRLGVDWDHKPNRKGNVKKQVEIARSK